jgi:hypothetical protein
MLESEVRILYPIPKRYANLKAQDLGHKVESLNMSKFERSKRARLCHSIGEILARSWMSISIGLYRLPVVGGDLLLEHRSER